MRKRLLLCVFMLFAFLSGRAQSGHAFYQEAGGSLNVCNNIIANNALSDANTDLSGNNNLVGHYPELFVDNLTDFRQRSRIYTYNLGNNGCVTWLYDMLGEPRVANDTVEIGAYEFPIFLYYPVFQLDNSQMTFCNNIIINNHAEENINVSVPATNYVTNSTEVFENDYVHFLPAASSVTVNAGDNSCVDDSLDLSGQERVLSYIVDLGAFEVFNSTDRYAVVQEEGGSLQFCNNVIINNHIDTNVNVGVNNTNYVVNGSGVFTHDYGNFVPADGSVILNAGSNECVTYTEDMVGASRIISDVVDKGAFEKTPKAGLYPVYQEEESTLQFCNNIIINNHLDTNVNVAVSNTNYIANSSAVFEHEYFLFKPVEQSVTIDAGNNSCVIFMKDAAGGERTYGAAVDMGAFEFYGFPEQYAVCQDGAAGLQFCNNIIINNYTDTNVNRTLSSTNYVTDGSDIFVQDYILFMLQEGSAAVDAGNNSCATFLYDNMGTGRVFNEVVDLGAYELFVFAKSYPVWQDNDGTLQFCNNIIINNHADTVANRSIPPFNFIQDSVVVFNDEYSDFTPTLYSAVVNAGSNSCSPWDKDIKGDNRVMNDVVEIGAFEVYLDMNQAIVYQDSGYHLLLCNNVIILNSGRTVNTNVQNVPASNITSDDIVVFRDERFDFRPLQYSDAVNAGDNSCNGLPTDLDTVTRISGGTIDIGAFEIVIEPDTNWAGGGGGGGSGGGGGGGGYMVPDYNAVVYEDPYSSLYLCNNIVINNNFAPNVNMTCDESNLVEDTINVFRNAVTDFRLVQHSVAVNRGNNSCNDLHFDIDRHQRIAMDTIDIGAYEYIPAQDVVTVLQDFGYQMNVCNNIIINNNSAFSVNDLTTPSNNILIDNNRIFRNNVFDFTPIQNSIAVNRGNNSCLSLAKDIADMPRVFQDTIDIGAYEQSQDPFYYAVIQVGDGQLNLCNNIIINNSGADNVSLEFDSVSDNNIVLNTNDLFKNNVTDYTPRANSAAINRGENSCCELAKDLEDAPRVSEWIIDIGAYEPFVKNDSLCFVVQGHTGSHLVLCNNIIINNSIAVNASDEAQQNHNIIRNTNLIFKDNVSNFEPRSGSEAINGGSNDCLELVRDMSGGTRIMQDTIDVGAYEPADIPDTMTFVVVQREGYTLHLCNNIIINNSIAINAPDEAEQNHNIIRNANDIFRHNIFNYKPRENSLAINGGSNVCLDLIMDMSGGGRIIQDTIDVGAYEPVEVLDTVVFAVVQKEGYMLQLCNNIIINNSQAENTNFDMVPQNNIVTNSDTLFVNAKYNYMPRFGTAAINAGSNSCTPWNRDLSAKARVTEEIIDIGAYEQYHIVDTVPSCVTESDSAGLILCNNIIINNPFAENSAVASVSSSNIVTDNDTLFRHNTYDYRPRVNSIAINSGDNDCVGWRQDVTRNRRICQEIVEIGAYECQVVDTVPQYAVLNDADPDADSTLQLHMYNNIVVYNPGNTMNMGGVVSGSHNLLTDLPNVFTDTLSDYTLPMNSPAVDAGDNQWVTWPVDIKEDPRIACANIVDQGAYEHAFTQFVVEITPSEVLSDDCQGSFTLLMATPGAQHYYWSHTNEDTNVVQVTPLLTTDYTVVASNGGECSDTATIRVAPAMLLSDSIGTPSSVGKVFWLTYLRNHFRVPILTVQISAERACSGTVRNPRTSWVMPFTVGANSVTTVHIPVNQAYPDEVDVVADFGILVEADDSVSVYAANYIASSFDVTNVLPVNALSDEYMIQTYTPMMNAEFVIVATEDSTVVEITPTKSLQGVSGSHPARQTYTVTLQRGQTYLGLSRNGGSLGDLTGTLVRSRDNKPIAVFNGNVCALVPASNSYTDHLVEQAMGVKYWGRSFAITGTYSQNFDVVRVTALRNNTEVKKNGTPVGVIQAGENYEFELTGNEGSCYIETSNPSGVYLYVAGAIQGNNLEMSDPSMIWIPPVEQKLNDLTFATFESSGIAGHYVNIVVPTASLESISLDDVPIGNQFTPLNGNDQYSFVRKQIPLGTHTLRSEEGFIAHVYGLGFHESYGYAAGSKAMPLKEQLYVNNVVSSELPLNQQFCPYEPIDFRVEVNYPCDSVLWNFGDGTALVNAITTTHAFSESGTYTVAATLYITSGETVYCTNLYARIKVSEGFTKIWYDTVCQGVPYTQHGFEVETSEAGHFVHTIIINVPNQYCDSTYVLELEVINSIQYVYDTICEQNPYMEYGFDIPASAPGLVMDTIRLSNSTDGCDSMVILSLLVTPNTENLPEISGESYPCMGEMFVYSLDSLSGLQQVHWIIPDSITVWEQTDDYHITLLFENYADTFEIAAFGHNKCGDTVLRKTIYPQPYNFVQISDTICDNESNYQGYGFDIANVSDTNDLFIHYDLSSTGCDSTTVLAIVIVPTYYTEDTVVLCDNELPYLYHDTLIETAGVYDITLSTVHGCDSVVSLHILTLETHQLTVDTSSCNSFVWNDSVYTQSGAYSQHFLNRFGCDSVVTMNLTIHRSDTTYLDSVVCRNELPLSWLGKQFEDAGIQHLELHTAYGCDSTVFLTVTVNELSEGEALFTILENQLPYEVNGVSYNSAGTYTQTLTNAAGCDSTLTFVLNVLNNVTNAADSTICSDQLPFVWNGVTFTRTDTLVAVLEAASGADSTVVMAVTVLEVTYGTFDTAIVENALPYSYNDSTYSAAGTYTQHLTNAVGCDSVVTLTLTVYPNVTEELDSVICEESLPLTWNDSVFTAAGTKSTVLPAHTGADSTVVMTVTVVSTTYGAFDTAIVENALPYHLNDSTYSAAGTYTQHLTNAAGCDSILTLTLTVYPNVTEELDSTVCEGILPLTWNDSIFTEAGTKTTIILASTGADSTITMTVTVIPTTYGAFDTAIVENALPYHYNDSMYSAAGTYTQYLTNAAGCDSILTLTLTVYPNVTSELDSVICEESLPLTWNDSVFTAAGTKSTVLLAHTGADSVVVMTLTVIPTTYGAFDTAIVENALPYSYNDSMYIAAGTYYQHLTNAAGCDSILTLTLMVYPNVTEEIDSTVCEGALPLTWNDSVFTAAGTKSTVLVAHTGADSTVVMAVAVIPTTYGIDERVSCDSLVWIDGVTYYADNDSATCRLVNAAGCDSVVTLHLTVNHPTVGVLTANVLENNLPYVCNGVEYFESGTYYQEFTNAVGCDSTLTIVLTVWNNVGTQLYDTVCEGQLPYTWNDSMFTEAGSKMSVYQAASGADSVVVMTLTVVPTTYGAFDTAIVENALPYHYNDSTYIEEGTYHQHLTNSLGCDSILTLTLTVLPNVTSEIDSAVCEGSFPFTWNDSVFTEAGVKTTTILASTGADSTITMTVTVIPTTYGTFDTTVNVNLLPVRYNDSLYTVAGTYTQYLTNAAGCDSILAFRIDVLAEVDSAVCETAFPFTWNDSVFTAPGTKSTVLAAASGADSTVVMTVTVVPTTYGAFDTAIVENALPYSYNDSTYVEEGIYHQHLTNSLGCDSILTLTLTVHPNVTVEVDSAVCEGALPFTWNDSVFTAAGTKSTVLAAHTGADSTVVMTVTVVPTTYGAFDTAIVENALPYWYNDSMYTAAGTYYQHLMNAAGCDSILTLTLTVYPNVTVELDSTVCEGALPLTWNDSVFTAAGTKTMVLAAHTGADSAVVMHLVVVPTVYHDVYETTCDSLTWINGVTYYENTDTATYLLAAASGCDSVVVLHLTVHRSTTAIDELTVCDSLTWINGITYYESIDTVTHMLSTAVGCDSLVTLHLTIEFAKFAEFADTACDSYTWNELTYTESGDYPQTFTASNGCDSTVTLHLTVLRSTTASVDTTVIQNALPLHYNDSTYGAAGTYYQHFTNAVGCDSTLTLHLSVLYNVTSTVDTTVCAADLPFTWHGHSFEAAGSHTVMLTASTGVDSTVTYVLSVDNLAASVGSVTHVTCYGESTGAATATVTGGTVPMTYQWANAAGTSVSTTTGMSGRPAGDYTFTVTDQTGCTATFTATINTLNGELAAGTIAASQEVCDGEDIAPFTGTEASGGDNGGYQWQTSNNGTDWTPAPGTNNTQNYTYPDPAADAFSLRRAWVSQSCGTVYSNVVTVSVWPNSSDTVFAEVCQGEGYEGYGFEIAPEQTVAAGEIVFEQHYASGHCDSAVILILTVHPQYETELADEVCEGDGYSANGFSVNPLETVGESVIRRELTLQSEYGCDSVVRLTLTVIDTALRIVPLTEDFCDGLSMELTVVTPMLDYEWSTGENAPTITVTASGYYSVTATQGGCSATASYRVEGCQNELYLPNAITPSRGDGLNDWFCIPETNKRDIGLFEISIFNRWGEMVYYSTDKNFKWNGEYRGSIQYQTVYNYVIRYTDTAGKPYVRTGSITVL